MYEVSQAAKPTSESLSQLPEAEATENLGLIGEDQLVEICSLSVDRDGRGPDDDEIYR